MTKYKITVSDPWNFNGPAGENLIIGEIVKVCSSQFLVFKSDDLLNFEGHDGHMLLLKPRYEKQILSQENNYEGTIDGGLLFTDDYEGKSGTDLEKNSKYVLIGNITMYEH